ncbi:MAG: hypothetical protein JWO33_1566, partial [Caulobacteraceae bacterium]|nr:hypothetical protein [Caulobacteraceae bacterium]
MVAWLFYEPILKRISRRAGAINTDMTVVRRAWMRAMTRRDSRFIDGQLMGHALNSASFFASANLIIIAAAAGALFGGETTYRSVVGVALLDRVPRIVFEAKLGLITLTLARGLLDFIWSIRQMNYCLAAIGAAPEDADPAVLDRYGEATGQLINPALSSFNAGVRGYYFALAAAAWLIGPIPLMAASLGAIGLLIWRQSRSRTARGIRAIREILESEPAPGPRSPPHGGG